MEKQFMDRINQEIESLAKKYAKSMEFDLHKFSILVIKEYQKAMKEAYFKAEYKLDELDDVYEALGITPKSKEVTGVTAVDAIKDLFKEIERLKARKKK